MIERYCTKNPSFKYLEYKYHQLNLRELLKAVFGQNVTEPIMRIIKKPQLLIEKSQPGKTKAIKYIEVTRDELILLAFLMRLSGIAFSIISTTFENMGVYIGTRQNIEQTLKSVSTEHLLEFANDTSHLMKQIIPMHKRPTFEQFHCKLYESLDLLTFGLLLELIRITNIKLEMLFGKYLIHYDNCTRRIARRKLLVSKKQVHNRKELSNQDKALLKKPQPISLLSPLDFIIIVIVNISLRKNKDFHQALTLVCSREEDEGHYRLGNTILDTQSQNSTYARLLEKEETTGFDTLDMYEKDREKLDMIRTIFDYVIGYQKQAIKEPDELLKHIETLIVHNQPHALKN